MVSKWFDGQGITAEAKRGLLVGSVLALVMFWVAESFLHNQVKAALNGRDKQYEAMAAYQHKAVALETTLASLETVSDSLGFVGRVLVSVHFNEEDDEILNEITREATAIRRELDEKRTHLEGLRESLGQLDWKKLNAEFEKAREWRAEKTAYLSWVEWLVKSLTIQSPNEEPETESDQDSEIEPGAPSTRPSESPTGLPGETEATAIALG